MHRKRKRAVIFLSLCLLAALWLYWGNTSIEVTLMEIEDKRLPEGFSGLTIVQVSDLHNASFGERQGRLLEKIEEASPDLIAVTGDLIDSDHTELGKAMEFIQGAAALAPVYYVTGNHEAWSEDWGDLEEQLKEAEVVVLRGEKAEVICHGIPFALIGLDDPAFNADGGEEAVEMGRRLEVLSERTDGYTILLSHRPELFDVYAEKEIDLVLSGHAHGGQMRIPFIGGLIAPNQGVFPLYTEGLFEKGQTKMVVSRGLGNSVIPVRVNNRPQLIVVKLK